jgi:hypothetical protein
LNRHQETALCQGAIKRVSLQPGTAVVIPTEALNPASRPVIPAKAGIQNKNGPLSFLKQGLAFNKKAVHGFKAEQRQGLWLQPWAGMMAICFIGRNPVLHPSG